MIKLDFYNKTKSSTSKNIFTALLIKAQKCLVKEQKIHPRSNLTIELTLVGNKTIADINYKFRKRNKPTDVISLSYFEKEMEDIFAGEIFISLPFAKKQALRFGHSFKNELQFLFIHGLLHIFGYDHAHMDKLTCRILGTDIVS